MLVYICTTFVPGVLGARKGIEFPEVGVIDSCELLCFGCWELKPNILEKQTVLLTSDQFSSHHVILNFVS